MNHAPLRLAALALAAASACAQQRAYLLDSNVNKLFTVDLATGAATAGPAVSGAVLPRGLTWRQDLGELWLVDFVTGQIGSVNVTTGAFTAKVIPAGFSTWQAIAWDPRTYRWYLANNSGQVHSVDPLTGTGTLLGSAGTGFSNLAALETDNNGVIYGIDATSGLLGTLNKSTGVMTAVGSAVVPTGMRGLAFDQFGQLYGTTSTTLFQIDKLLGGPAMAVGPLGAGVSAVAELEIVDPSAYAVDSNNDKLLTVDLATGASTLIASTLNGGLGTPAGLAWRNDTGELWTIDLGGSGVGTIDTWTGIFTVRHPATPATGWQDIAWDASTARFYLFNQDGKNYVLDPATGLTTLLGAAGTGFTLITGACVDRLGTLWAMDFGGRIGTVDRASGVTSLYSMCTVTNFQGLSFTGDNRAYGITTSGQQPLYSIDLKTGVATLIGQTNPGTGPFVKGFTIVTTQRSGSAVTSGVGCQDFGGVRLALQASGSPCLGATLGIGTALSSQTSFFVLMLGGSNTSYGGLPLPFSLNVINAPGCSVYCSLDVNLGGAPSPIPGRIDIPLPNNQGLLGTPLYMQSIVFDGRINGLGLATSDLLTLRLGVER